MANVLTKTPDKNVDTGEEIDIYYSNITGKYSDHDILEEETETISKNYEVWVKTKTEIWKGRVLIIPYNKKRG